ncbi:hypothetical protein LB941_00905 [Ligilactobacillus sp. WILCCON 0076]|uniref:Uncharacterized protein n=1 Tax=Ligilactobacillus ubinensis TaxID=2876789 RepID=A0A9X2FG93_9LACO|nr:hypothetical protein [Ligilactobacillus ubinensis]MCP0885892.1 hypothetical protein [Ligilactobacillus ubinensis]
MRIGWVKITTSKTEEAKKHYDDTKKGILKLTVSEARMKTRNYTTLALHYEALNFCGDELNDLIDKESDYES